MGSSDWTSEPLGPSSVELALDAGRVDVFVDVVEVPCPLLGDDLDLHVDLVGCESLLDGRLVAGGEGEEAEHEDQRHGRVEDLDRHVVAHLHRQAGLALAATVRDDRPDRETPGDDADDEQHDPRRHPEAGDALGVVRDRRLTLDEAGKESVQLRLRATSEHETENRCNRNSSPSETAIVAHQGPFGRLEGASQ